ncbi:MAG: FtsX-like permease family protein [Chloroflexota bacterium]
MRLVSATVALLRRLRAERGVVLFLFVLVATTSFLVAVGPRLLDRVSDEGLRDGFVRATALQRNIEFASADRIPPGDTPFAGVEAMGDRLWDRIPASVQRIVGDRGYVVETPRFRVGDPPNYTTFVTFRSQAGLDGHIEYSSGRAPVRLPASPVASGPARLEIAISEEAAAETHIALGDTLRLTVDPGDPIMRNLFPRPTGEADVSVVGLYRAREPASPYWFDDPAPIRAAVGGTVDNPIAYVAGIIAPEAYPDAFALDLPTAYRWRFFVDAAGIDAGQLDALVPDLRRLKTEFEAAGGVRDAIPNLRTGLAAVVDRFLSERAAAEAVLAVAALGPMAVAAGALGLIAILVIRRRRAGIILARGRGASGGQLLVAQLVEGLLITIPAALVGLALASVIVPVRAGGASPVGAILVALAATAILTLATWPLARRARRQLERDDGTVTSVSPRRLVFEVLVIGLAVTGAWLLRERGLTAEGSGSGIRAFDPFLALSPVLVGLAVALITIRLSPYPVRAIGWLAGHRRDLVAVLGLRTIGRDPTAAYLPLLVLMLTVAIGTFTSVVRVTVDEGQIADSWRLVGADYRVENRNGGTLAPAVDPSVIPGIGAVAAAYRVPAAPFVLSAGRAASTSLLAVEPDPFAAVIAGSPIDRPMPSSFATAPASASTGTIDDPIPAVVSSRPPTGQEGPVSGDVFVLTVAGDKVAFRVDEIADSFPGIRTSGSFVAAPYASLVAATDGHVRPSDYFLRGDASLGPAVERTLVAQSASARVDSRHDRYAAVHEAPFVSGVAGGFGLALAIALVYATLAVVAVVLLDAQRRSRELGFLRTLGLTEPQAASLTAVEHGLPILVAVVVGVALGLGVAILLEPGLGLATFIGEDATVQLEVDWPSVGIVVGTVVLVVGAAIALSVWLVGRLELGRVMRIGDE